MRTKGWSILDIAEKLTPGCRVQGKVVDIVRDGTVYFDDSSTLPLSDVLEFKGPTLSYIRRLALQKVGNSSIVWDTSSPLGPKLSLAFFEDDGTLTLEHQVWGKNREEVSCRAVRLILTLEQMRD